MLMHCPMPWICSTAVFLEFTQHMVLDKFDQNSFHRSGLLMHSVSLLAPLALHHSLPGCLLLHQAEVLTTIVSKKSRNENLSISPHILLVVESRVWQQLVNLWCVLRNLRFRFFLLRSFRQSLTPEYLLRI